MTGTVGRLPVVPCAGVPITACNRETAAQEVVRLAETLPAGRRTPGLDVHLCNAYTLALADRDPQLRRLLGAAALNFPDGKSVVWANRLLHRDAAVSTERVYGPDLFGDVVELGRGSHLRHYLLGSTPDVLSRLRARLLERYPGAVIVGAESPPFRAPTAEEQRQQAARVAAARTDVVWVGLGTPKQDVTVARLAAQVPAVCVAVGAAFDFLAGTKRQAPRWMRDNGLEWVHRLACEPGRLWRRYLFGNARFVAAAVRHRRGGR